MDSTDRGILKNANEVFVVVNNYRQNDWKPHLFYSKWYGATWKKNLASDQTITGHVWCVTQDTKVDNLLFLGTEEGLYFSTTMGSKWQKWNNGFPSVPVVDMKIHPRDHDLVIATFGRAFWILDDITPLREIASSQNKVLIISDCFRWRMHTRYKPGPSMGNGSWQTQSHGYQ